MRRITAPRPVRTTAIALLALAATMLAACGSDDADSSAATTVGIEAPAAADPSATAAITSEPSTTEPATTDLASTVVETSTTVPEAHVVAHAMGETEVPGAPARIVVLDSSFLDASIALGLPPIAATEGVAGSGLPAYLGGATDDVELVGLTTEPNLEQIAALEPDLILGAKVRHEALYPQLSQIAPTVFSESSGTNWTDQVTLTGEALNRSDEAEALLAEFDQRAAAVGQAIGAAGKTAVIIRFVPGQIRLYGPSTFSGSVLTRVGFDLGDKGYDPAVGMALISSEQIDMIDTDVIFATNPDAESAGAVVTDRGTVESLWATLPAVQSGNEFDVLDSTWMTGIGVIGANAILDDLESFFS